MVKALEKELLSEYFLEKQDLIENLGLVGRNQKSPRISARASIMVPRPGIEPGTRGFSMQITTLKH